MSNGIFEFILILFVTVDSLQAQNEMGLKVLF